MFARLRVNQLVAVLPIAVSSATWPDSDKGEFARPTSPIRVWGREADRLTYRRSLFVAGVCQSPLLNGEGRRFSPEELLDQIFNFLNIGLRGGRRCSQS